MYDKGTNEDNTLTAAVTQSFLRFNQNTATTIAEEQYKGPTSMLSDWHTKFKTGQNREVVAEELGINMQPFAVTEENKWVLGDAKIERCNAGEHSTATFTWQIVPIDWIPPDQDDAPAVIQSNLTWEAYTVDILGFCSNKWHEEFVPDVDGSKLSSTSAYAPYIQNYIQAQWKNGIKTTVAEQIPFTYYKDNVWRRLNVNEAKIAAKFDSGTHYVQYHRPVYSFVVTSPKKESVSAIMTMSEFSKFGKGIDHTIRAGENNVPDSWRPGGTKATLSDWNFIKTEDNLNQTQSDGKYQLVRTIKYVGIISADPNLYGWESRWHLSGL